MAVDGCATQGLRAGCVAGVIANRRRSESPDEAGAERVEITTRRVVIEAARRLLDG